MPVRFCGSFGRNQEAHSGTILGLDCEDVESFRAESNSVGVTR